MVITLVFSTDARGFALPATVVASVLRRTQARVIVKIYTRGVSAESFRSGRLEVEFRRCDGEVGGIYSQHVSEAVFDRLRIIRDETEWDRVLIMDHDMLALCDLAEYFAEPFGESLLMSRLFDKGNTLGFHLRNRGGLPEDWLQAADHPLFFMGPMMNLVAMRREGIWERLLEAHTAIGQDDRVALAAACGGRVRGVAAKWNLVPKWDGSLMHPDGEQWNPELQWRNGVPEGLVHWTGPLKPWFRNSKAWRADLWDSEACDWEQLRAGRWEKPLAVEVKPDSLFRARALLRRGWRVQVRDFDREEAVSYPDFAFANGEDGTGRSEEMELLRFGPEALPSPFDSLSDSVALEGPRTRGDMAAMRAMGFLGEARIRRDRWAAGGPHPKVLSYGDPGGAFAVAHDEDCYLSRMEQHRKPVSPPDESDPWSGEDDGEAQTLIEVLAEPLADRMAATGAILVFGPGRPLRKLARRFPKANLIGVEHDVGRWRQVKHALRDLANVEVHHASLDPTLPWYDLSGVAVPELDCVIVAGRGGESSRINGNGWMSVLGLLKPGALVLLCDQEKADGTADEVAWTEAGCETLRKDGTVRLLAFSKSNERDRRHPGCGKIRKKDGLADVVYVMTTLGCPESLAGLRTNWERFGCDYVVLPPLSPHPSNIRWEEMRGIDASQRTDALRGDHVVEAIGERMGGIAALERFVASGAETALICRDDCRWKPRAAEMAGAAARQLPEEWDLLYFSAPRGAIHLPFATRLTRMRGARLCTAILWQRTTALDLLPELRACDCEFDIFLERSHTRLNAFCAVPMPAYQATTHRNHIPSHEQPSQS